MKEKATAFAVGATGYPCIEILARGHTHWSMALLGGICAVSYTHLDVYKRQERIREIICDQLDLEEDKVTMDSDIMEDFEADSLDVVDLVMSIEDEFGLEVPDDQIENFRTVGDVVRYIEENS